MKATEVRLKEKEPSLVAWARRKLEVLEIVDHWSELGRWWEHEGECEFYLVETEIGLLLLGRDVLSEKWYGKAVK